MPPSMLQAALVCHTLVATEMPVSVKQPVMNETLLRIA